MGLNSMKLEYRAAERANFITTCHATPRRAARHAYRPISRQTVLRRGIIFSNRCAVYLLIYTKSLLMGARG